MDLNITLPLHAARYLLKMCHEERKRLAKIGAKQYSIQMDAAFDSIDALESAMPKGLHEEVKGG